MAHMPRNDDRDDEAQLAAAVALMTRNVAQLLVQYEDILRLYPEHDVATMTLAAAIEDFDAWPRATLASTLARAVAKLHEVAPPLDELERRRTAMLLVRAERQKRRRR